MCVGSQGGGAPPIRLSDFRSELRRQEGRDPTDTFASDFSGPSNSGLALRAEQSGGGGRSVGSVFDLLNNRRAENKRIESGLIGGTLGQGGGSLLAASPTQTREAQVSPSLIRARQRRG